MPFSLAEVAAESALDNVYDPNSKKSTEFITFKIADKRCQILINGHVSTNGIAVNEFKKVKNYSIGVKLGDEDLKALTELTTGFIKQTSLPNEYRITNPAKEDVVYFKLKISKDKKSFENVVTASKYKLDPKKIDHSGLERGDPITMIAEIGGYISYDTDTNGNMNAGIYFTLKEIM